ncbi:MAG: hypothetical protein GX893_03535 [Firmicutes bacterium]|nr:hypothetical protein [Bacillota bacterium]
MQKRRKFRVITGEKQEEKRKSGKLLYKLLGLAVGLLLLQLSWSAGRKVVAALFIKTITAQKGVLEQSLPVEGVIIRHERVMAAPVSGTLHWQVETGERLALGETVAKIVTVAGNTHTVTMPEPGVVVRELDGLESMLLPLLVENPVSLDFEKLKQSGLQVETLANGAEVQQGSLFFKIVNNHSWYYAVQFKKEHFISLDGKQTVYLRFSGSENIAAQVKSLREDGEKITAVFMLQQSVDEYYRQRFLAAELIADRTAAIILPAQAIVLRDGQAGVYVLEKSYVRFLPVQVLQAGKEKVAVDGVREGMSVIVNPRLVKEGQKI